MFWTALIAHWSTSWEQFYYLNIRKENNDSLMGVIWQIHFQSYQVEWIIICKRKHKSGFTCWYNKTNPLPDLSPRKDIDAEKIPQAINSAKFVWHTLRPWNELRVFPLRPGVYYVTMGASVTFIGLSLTGIKKTLCYIMTSSIKSSCWKHFATMTSIFFQAWDP